MGYREYLSAMNESEAVKTTWVDVEGKELYINDYIEIAYKHKEIYATIKDEDPNKGLLYVIINGEKNMKTNKMYLYKKSYEQGDFEIFKQ